MRRLTSTRLAAVTLLLALLLLTGLLSISAQEQPEATPEITPAETVSAPPTETPPPTELPPAENPTDLPTPEATSEATQAMTPETTSTAPTPAPTLPGLPPEPALLLLYADSFAAGTASVWMMDARWTVIASDADFALQGGGSPLELALYDNLLDVAVQARLWTASGAARLQARVSAAGSYTAELLPEGVANLYRAGALLQSAAVPPASADPWRVLRLSAIGGMLRVAVDGVELIALEDSAPLPPGKIVVSGSENALFRVDDVQLWIPADQPIPPTAVMTPPAVPTETITPAPEITAEPTLETTPEATLEATAEATAETTPDMTTAPEISPRAAGAVAPSSMIFVVTSKFDLTSDGICDADCTLRDAITAANANPGPDTITFNIPVDSSPFTIYPVACKLPDIIEQVTIDGYTQPLAVPASDAAAEIKIGLMGNSANGTGGACPNNPDGLKIYKHPTNTAIDGSGTVIRGLSITGWQSNGILVDGANNVVIEGNFIGLEVEGNVEAGNLADGIRLVNADNTTIGGLTPDKRNIISGNASDGIEITTGSDGTQILGNYIGLDKNGVSDRGNTVNGILLNEASAVVGGVKPLAAGGACRGACNVISGNNQNGIVISGVGANGSTVQGNYVGLNWNGTQRVPNTLNGVKVEGSGYNTIGGTTNTTPGGDCTGACNVITGNDGMGIEILPKTVAVIGNLVVGNYIGTNPAGTGLVTTALVTGNKLGGIRINNVADVTIGTTNPAARNVISGNQATTTTTAYGITVQGTITTNTKIYSNYIGTNAAGTAALGNDVGILIKSPSSFVGDLGTQFRNVISGNLSNGIEILGTGLFERDNPSSNRIRGNYIGVSADGMSAVPNGGDGVRIVDAFNNFIGDQYLNSSNIISGNAGNGITITGVQSESTRVQRNYIGVNVNNTAALPNGANGVLITNHAHHNQVGLDNSDDPSTSTRYNVIAWNALAGIAIDTDGTGNTAMNNQLLNNGGLGIDLGPTGVTLNDPGDADTGSNNLQNYPTLLSVQRSGGQVTIQARLETLVGWEYRVDFFTNTTCDPTSYGEGAKFLGKKVFPATGTTTTFSETFPESLFDAAASDFFTMTATSYDFLEYNTSEFSKCASRFNNPPTISDIADQTTRGIVPVDNLTFTVDDIETPRGSLTVTAWALDSVLVPPGNIIVTNLGNGNHSLKVSAAPGQPPSTGQPNKTTVIVVRVTDQSGAFNDEAFTLTITPNALPTMNTISNVTTDSGKPIDVAVTVGDPDADDVSRLTVTATTSTNTTLIPLENITATGSGTSWTARIQPVPGIPISGNLTSNITLTVSDGDKTASRTFTVTVTQNDPPTISTIADTGTVTNRSKIIPFTISDPETALNSLTITKASSDESVVPLGNITPACDNGACTVTVAPMPNIPASGTVFSNITLTVSDGFKTASRLFKFTVAYNNPATFVGSTPIADKSTKEGTAINVTFTIADNATDKTYVPLSQLVVTGVSNNQSLVPNANIVIPACTTAGACTATITPVGSVTVNTPVIITLTIQDGSPPASTSFTLTIQPDPANAAPTISDIPNQKTTTSIPLSNVPFTVNDTETAADLLTVTGVSSNKTLVPDANIRIDNLGGQNRAVTITPAAGKTGVTTITLTVRDAAGKTAVDTFDLTVDSNTPPTISDIPDQTTPINTPIYNIGFTVSDKESTAGLTVSGTSNNTTLIPNDGIAFGVSSNGRFLNITPANGQTGQALITITVTDAGGLTGRDTFTVTVNPNSPPTISSIPTTYTTIDLPTGPIPFTVGDLETPNNLSVTASSSNTSLVPNDLVNNLILGGSGLNRSINVIPTGGMADSTDITITVTDGHGDSSSITFALIVTENNQPSISAIADEAIAPNTYAGPILFSISDPETPAAALQVDATSSNTTLVPVSNIVFGGLNSERTMTIFPVYGQSGTTLITVTVTDSAGASASALFTLAVQVAAPIPTAPANLGTAATVIPKFTWSLVTGAKQYKLQVNDNADFNVGPLEIDTTIAVASYTSTVQLLQNKYYWRVKALNASGGDLTGWSLVPSFTVNLLKTPANRSFTTDTTPTFTWNAVLNATYQLEVGRTQPGTGGFVNLVTGCAPTAITCTPTTALAEGVYYWRVNVNGVASKVIGQFTITPTPPAAPTLNKPTTASFLNTATPKLEWFAVTGTLGTPYTYEVQVDNQSTFASPEYIGTGITGTNVTVSTPLENRLYSWRVRAVNNLGVPGAWSLVRTFTVDTQPPATPAIKTPADGFVTNDTTPTFTWGTVAGANRYTVELSTESDFDPLLIPAATVTVGTYTVPAASAMTNGTYYWRVTALDAASNTSEATPTRALIVSIMKTPAQGAYTTDTTPTFVWSAVKTGTRYTLQITRESDPGFTSPITVPASCQNIIGITCTLTSALPLDRYMWRVNVNGAASERAWLLIVTPATPLPPVLVLPANLGVTNDSTPTLTWNFSASSLGQPYSYEVQVDNQTTFATPEFTRDGIAGSMVTVTTALPDGKYYWRARTLNQLGAWSAWTISRSFTVDTQPPPAPVLKTPESNAILVDNTPALAWNASTGANRYRVDIATDSSFTHLVVNGATVTTTTYTVPNALALPDGMYYWRVRAMDAAGNVNPLSQTQSRNFLIAAP